MKKSKKEFERLQFTKLNYKYDYPYTLQRDEGVYYPMIVHNTFFSFNLYDMVIGGRLKTGGLGVLDALFYHLSNASPKRERYQYLVIRSGLRSAVIDIPFDAIGGVDERGRVINPEYEEIFYQVDRKKTH